MDSKHANIFKDAFNGLLDLIYPPYCLVCGKAGEDYLCAKCIEKIDFIEPPFCRKCGTPCAEYNCSDCRSREYYFDISRSAAIYDGVLKEAIRQFKYKFNIVMADPLSEIMINRFPKSGLIGKFDFVIPVPIHQARRIERGFNQAEELASRFCDKIHVPLDLDVLYKKTDTKHQANLPQDMRAVNLKGVFAVKNSSRVIGKRILLVDDVFTTGTTLNEAAKALKNSGALSICAYTLAKSL